ncbi:Kelch repeat-containing protein [Pontibacter rugosus]|uniref:Kelch repeat-containing protein n=1 Tax=Pontibacter rugosus TaxID=1745966 RepID=A0ABW3SSG7_9BACT
MKNLFRNMRLLSALALVLSICVLTSCDSEDELVIGEWQPRADFAGVARSSAVSFVIDGKAYVGTGYDGTKRLQDFWMYEPNANTWTKIADFPGEARSAAVAFSANGKGYVGTGYNGSNYLNDFYEYTPSSNTWTRVADLPASARFGAVALSFSNSGYVGAGYDGTYLKDFWMYNAEEDNWVAQQEMSGARRLNGFAFVANGKGYIGGGINNNVYNTDLIEFDPATGAWRNLKTLSTTDRSGGEFPVFSAGSLMGSFSVGSNGYLVNTGVNSAANTLELQVWKFDPATDTWTQLRKFRGPTRSSAVGFGIGDKGYFGLGMNTLDFKKDFWSLDPAVANKK